MRTQFLAFLILLGASQLHAFDSRHIAVAHRRQASPSPPPATGPPAVTTPPQPPSTQPPPAQNTPPPPPPPGPQPPAAAPPGPPPPPGSSGSSGSSVSSGSASSSGPAPLPSTTYPAPAGTGIPSIQNITSGLPSGTTLPVTTTFAAGATPPISGAPPLPTPFVFNAADWPQQDQVPQTNSPQVQAWMKELDGFNIPDLNPTADGSCVGDPVAATNAANRGWWTCGGYTRDTDIVACPDKLTWGVSFDDGPAPYTQTLLKYLTEKNVKATFFVVGSRVIERPQVLLEEYMAGHQISVHTWSHRPLTSLTNEQIVAELGWTRLAIKTVLGVTPVFMRPPYGDIDDRVRAITLAMGMIPMIWTRGPDGTQFDTNDWRVAGGLVTGIQSLQSFQSILGNATLIKTGFIVLQHDLFEITVDLATGYFLPAALSHNPPFTLETIGQCMKIPTTDLYLETTKNSTFPYRNHTAGGLDVNGDGKVDDKPGIDNGSNTGFILSIPALGSILAAGIAVLGTLL